MELRLLHFCCEVSSFERICMSAPRYKLPHEIGMGGVPLGNEFRVTTDEQAAATLQTAWEAGIRYFDVAPHYGLGLAERRYGQFLHRQPRDSFVLSSKVGRLLKAGREHRDQRLMPYSPSPNIELYDYSRDATLRSIEDTLQRTGLDSIDIIYVHDLSPDNEDALPKPWLEIWPDAVEGCFATLCELREQGVIKAWGMGVNSPEPILKAMEDSDPDLHLMASQYSLVEPLSLRFVERNYLERSHGKAPQTGRGGFRARGRLARRSAPICQSPGRRAGGRGRYGATR
jgi:D-threo-aldose 1-dehydrogenase